MLVMIKAKPIELYEYLAENPATRKRIFENNREIYFTGKVIDNLLDGSKTMIFKDKGFHTSWRFIHTSEKIYLNIEQ